MPTKTGQALNQIAAERISAQECCQSCWDSWDALVDSLQNDKDALDDEVSELLDKLQDQKQVIVGLRESLAKWTKRAEDVETRYAQLVEVTALRTDQNAKGA